MVEFLDPIKNKNIFFHLDEKLKKKWDSLREGKLTELSEDRVYLVDGRERIGKSSFAFQQAKYLDPTFDINNICFTPEEFLDRIRTAPKGSVIVFDEAFRGLSSKSTRSKTNKAIVEAMMEVGQRNLIIFIVLPTIFLLELYAAVFRSECLFHIYKLKKKDYKKISYRAFKIYNYAKKKELYLRGKTKYFSYSRPKIRMAKGRFFVIKNDKWKAGIPYATFDMEAYSEKKSKAFASNIGKKEEDEDNKFYIQRNLIIKHMYLTQIHSHRKLSAWLEQAGMPLSGVQVGKIVGKAVEIKETDS